MEVALRFTAARAVGADAKGERDVAFLLRLGLACIVLACACCAATGAVQVQQCSIKDTEEAANGLILAVANQDNAALNAIFGAKAATLRTTGDPSQDKAQRDEFVPLAAKSHRLERDAMDINRMILTIGDDEWLFPVPIVRSGDRWIFDTSMGEKLVRAQRIGADELDAIEICAGFVAAQEQYALRHGAMGYAPRLLSSPRKDDGPYSEAQPLVPRRFAESTARVCKGPPQEVSRLLLSGLDGTGTCSRWWRTQLSFARSPAGRICPGRVADATCCDRRAHLYRQPGWSRV